MNLSPVGAASAPVYEPPPASLNHDATPGAVTGPATAHGSDHHHHHDGGGADSADTQSGQLPVPSNPAQQPSAAQQGPQGALQGVPPAAAAAVAVAAAQTDLTERATAAPAATATASTGSPATASARTSAAAARNLSSLATSTGISPGDLLKQLNAGDDLSDALGSTGDTGYGSTVGAAVGGGVAVDEYA